MREKFAGTAAPEFFEFFRELARDAKPSIRHDVDASGERFD